MPSRSNTPEEKFLAVADYWDLPRLYTDLERAKYIYDPQKRAGLREDTEKMYLRGLLYGYSPDQIAILTNKQAGGLHSTLSRTLYRYIEILREKPLKSLNNWRDVVIWLESYKLKENPLPFTPQPSWIDLPELSTFYGRTQELIKLEHWIVKDNCSLISVSGMGGIGKTSLTIHCASQLQSQFKYILWRSLRHAPPLKQFLAEVMLCFWKPEEKIELLNSTQGIEQLLKYLQSEPCLLIIDDWESVFTPGEISGIYQQKYEDYSQLIYSIANINNQKSTNDQKSCVLINSRENLNKIALLAVNNPKVKTLALEGLKVEDAGSILRENKLNDPQEWGVIIKLYRGNPLALMMIARTIKYLFNGSVSEFLKLNTLIIDNEIGGFLNQQFERLSALEKEIIYWLAIERQPVILMEIRKNVRLPISESDFLTALESLGSRFFIEKIIDDDMTYFTLQPTIIRYITKHLVREICAEFSVSMIHKTADKFNLVRNLRLVTAAQDSQIYSFQLRLLLIPIREQLVDMFKSDHRLEEHIDDLLSLLKDCTEIECGYTRYNLESLRNTLNM